MRGGPAGTRVKRPEGDITSPRGDALPQDGEHTSPIRVSPRIRQLQGRLMESLPGETGTGGSAWECLSPAQREALLSLHAASRSQQQQHISTDDSSEGQDLRKGGPGQQAPGRRPSGGGPGGRGGSGAPPALIRFTRSRSYDDRLESETDDSGVRGLGPGTGTSSGATSHNSHEDDSSDPGIRTCITSTRFTKANSIERLNDAARHKHTTRNDGPPSKISNNNNALHVTNTLGNVNRIITKQINKGGHISAAGITLDCRNVQGEKKRRSRVDLDDRFKEKTEEVNLDSVRESECFTKVEYDDFQTNKIPITRRTLIEKFENETKLQSLKEINETLSSEEYDCVVENINSLNKKDKEKQNLDHKYVKDFSEHVHSGVRKEKLNLDHKYVKDFSEHINSGVRKEKQNLDHKYVKDFRENVHSGVRKEKQNVDHKYAKDFSEHVNSGVRKEKQNFDNKYVKDFSEHVHSGVRSRYDATSRQYWHNLEGQLNKNPFCSNERYLNKISKSENIIKRTNINETDPFIRDQSNEKTERSKLMDKHDKPCERPKSSKKVSVDPPKSNLKVTYGANVNPSLDYRNKLNQEQMNKYSSNWNSIILNTDIPIKQSTANINNNHISSSTSRAQAGVNETHFTKNTSNDMVRSTGNLSGKLQQKHVETNWMLNDGKQTLNESQERLSSRKYFRSKSLDRKYLDDSTDESDFEMRRRFDRERRYQRVNQDWEVSNSRGSDRVRGRTRETDNSYKEQNIKPKAKSAWDLSSDVKTLSREYDEFDESNFHSRSDFRERWQNEEAGVSTPYIVNDNSDFNRRQWNRRSCDFDLDFSNDDGLGKCEDFGEFDRKRWYRRSCDLDLDYELHHSQNQRNPEWTTDFSRHTLESSGRPSKTFIDFESNRLSSQVQTRFNEAELRFLQMQRQQYQVQNRSKSRCEDNLRSKSRLDDESGRRTRLEEHYRSKTSMEHREKPRERSKTPHLLRGKLRILKSILSF